MQLWPEAEMQLLMGLALTALIVIVAIFFYYRNKIEYYKRIFKRIIIIGGIGLIVYLTPTSTILVGCSVFKRVNEDNYSKKFKLPGVIKISDNFYCDQTEMCNLSWLEYQYWTRKVFGSKSKEYRETLLDTNVWLSKYVCSYSNNPKNDSIYNGDYFRLPKFRNYPIVGITQNQTLDYSKWRSDRVFELILIELNKIEEDTAQNKDSYFTIERYYNDELKYINPGEKLKYYPEYRLPTLDERKIILHYADSIQKTYINNRRKFKKWNLWKETNIYPVSDIIPCLRDTFINIPYIPVNNSCFTSSINNLRGNVSEWTSENEITVGGGWLDKRERIMQTDTFHTKSPNAWTGFRCVCEWKKWEE